MDDAVFDAILAEVNGPAAEVATDDADALLLAAAPDSVEALDEPSEEPGDESLDAEPDEANERLAALEAQLAETQAQREADAKALREARERETERQRAEEQALSAASIARASQIIASLQLEPEDQQKLGQALTHAILPLQRDARRQQAVATEHAKMATALHMALSTLPPEHVSQVMTLAHRLYAQPGLDAMQGEIAQRRQTSLEQRNQQLEALIRQAALRQQANQRRASGADQVDRAPTTTAPAAGAADRFDDWFEEMYASLR